MNEAASALIGGGLALASLTVWIVILMKRAAGFPIVAAEPRRDVPWGIDDVVIVLIGFVFFTFVAATLVDVTVGLPSKANDDAAAGVNDWTPLLLADGVAKAATIGLAIVLGVVRGRATAADFGLTFQRAAEDFKLGGLGFLAALLPVYCVQAVMIQFVPPDKHPVLQMLSEHSTPVSLAVAIFFAVVVAPLAEEFLFRAFLQGWLESSTWKQAFMRALGPFRRAEAPADVMPIDFDAASLDGTPIVDGVHQTAVSGPAIDELATYVPARPDYLAILVSSAVFAALHASNWPAPIPLFFLALILGYLYHRTHRLLPCIVVHLLFNGLSVAAVVSGLPVK